MSNPLLAPQIKSKLDTSTETFAENKTAMMEKLEKIEELLEKNIQVEIEKVKYDASLLLKPLKDPKIKLN